MPNKDDPKNPPEPTILKKDVKPPKPPKPPKPTSNETVIQAKNSQPANPINKDSGNRKTLSTDRRDEALTRLYSNLKTDDSTEGFKQAKHEADVALSENKIILNKRFVLESVIGVGGMGTVYLAKDLRKVEANDLKPYVAVKVLNDNFKNHPNAFVTLQREASRSHTLSHPNIVTVHDFDRDGEVIFMTMELLKGQPLDDVIREAPSGLPLDKATLIIKGFCSALIHAHSKGIVHSDLKPGNIFVTKSAVKVLDFGIARSVSHSAAVGDFDAGSLGALTPAYATIEMFEGKDPHPSDDVFATAIIAYQLLTGKHPFQNHSAQEAVQKRIKPEKPSNINKYQWQALKSALALSRQDRTPSISQFLQTFTYVKKFPLFKILTGTSLLATAILAYSIFNAPDDVAIAVDTAYKKAEQCALKGDLNCAIESSKAVLEISPNHTQASELLNESNKKLALKIELETKNSIEQCANNRDVLCIQNAIARLKNLIPNSLDIDKYNQVISETKLDIELSQLIRQGYDCLDAEVVSNENIACSQRALDAGIAISAEDPAVLKLKNDVAFHLTKIINENRVRESEINEILNSAEKCLDMNKFDCAIKGSRDALSIDKTNAKALSIQQKAVFKKQQSSDNLIKAEKLMSKAGKCFETKNFTCAITNSESALEFVPNYPPAIKLIDKSKQQVELLKNSFKIN